MGIVIGLRTSTPIADMTNKGKKIRNILIGVGIAVIALIAIVIIFISPITKYLIEKYDMKYLGREITVDWVYVNPFTGYAHLHNLKVYEPGGKDTIFFSANGASVNFAMFKILSKTYEIENFTLSRPYARIVQNRQQFNFDDIVKRFAPKDTIKDTTKAPVHFNILDVAIENGEFHYEERSIPVSYFVKNVNVSSPGKKWDIDSTMVKFAIESGPSKGAIKGDFHIDLKTMEYRVAAEINKFDLHFIQQYIKDFSNYGTFYANLDGDIKANGNIAIKLAVEATGWIAINEFHFGKVPGEDYLAFEQLRIAMVDVNPRAFSYYIDTIKVDKPYFKYERYDNLDNVSALFGKNMSNIKAAKADSSKFNLVIEIGKYVNDIVKNFLQSYYKINRVDINNADIRFNDFSTREKFTVAADPLTLTADSIDKNHKRMNVALKTAIKPYGDLNVSLSLDPNNYGNFNVAYNIEKIPLPMFNPYLISYTSFPLDRGALEFHGALNVVENNIQSNNHLLILDPRVGKRLKKHQDAKWLPVPFIMSIVRANSGVIDISVPIAGNMKDPKFKLGGAILTIVENLFVKPLTAPYIFHVKDEEQKVEKFLTLRWETRKSTLRYGEERFLDKMDEFLRENPQAGIIVSPLEYTDKEKEYILFFEAKKKYFYHDRKSKVMTDDDSMVIDKMSIKDSTFGHYLNKLIGDTPMFTIQEKCKWYLGGEGIVTARYNELLKNRKNSFLSYFDEETRKRISIATPKAIIPYNGFSIYRIDYKGDVPQKLRDAYEEISDLDEENPRKKYQKAREKNGHLSLKERIKARRNK
jgi:hypothetical protein